ncbi:MAG: type II toxin-antitoxin system VapC family toxin [Methylococcales bacterium]|nr:type II toxin-antitoxin system VapC family toxin [Methylococcales bacterium]
MADSRILVDTSVLIDFLRKDKKDRTILWNLQENYRCTMSSVTLFELLCGAKTEKHLADVHILQKWIDSLPFNDRVSETAATLFRELKAQNKLIEFRDIFIAATAYVHDLPVATLNKKHFENIEQITLIELNNNETQI